MSIGTFFVLNGLRDGERDQPAFIDADRSGVKRMADGWWYVLPDCDTPRGPYVSRQHAIAAATEELNDNE